MNNLIPILDMKQILKEEGRKNIDKILFIALSKLLKASPEDYPGSATFTVIIDSTEKGGNIFKIEGTKDLPPEITCFPRFKK